MKTPPKCLECIINQGHKLGEILTKDLKLRARIDKAVRDYVSFLNEKNLEDSPAELSTPVYALIKEITGVEDPFNELKLLQNKNALGLYEDMMNIVNKSTNPLFTAAKISAIGNSIDCGINTTITNLETELEHALKEDFAVNDFPEFKEFLPDAKSLLLITDNAGEIVFDKCFIAFIKRYFQNIKIFVSVKSEPILNDATKEDALQVGIDKYAEIISTGSNYIGVPENHVSEKFLTLMQEADIILSKGQGNYETLEYMKHKTFFILKAKCPIIAEDIGVPINALIFKKGTNHN